MFEVIVHVDVEDDLAKLDRRLQQQLLTVFRTRLTEAPSQYGKPLSGSLQGLRRVRMGDYRIAYQVTGKIVKVWAVRHRSEVYDVAVKRFQKPLNPHDS